LKPQFCVCVYVNLVPLAGFQYRVFRRVRIRRAAISFVMFVCLSEYMGTTPTAPTSVKLNIQDFY
jgi:hypothetical protein